MNISDGAVPEVDAADVPAQAYVLDVREPDEWQAGHAPSAVHIPMSELNTRFAELPADVPIYVVCRAGVRSAHVTQALARVGREAYNVGGGMQSWAAAGRPMVAEAAAAPYVA